jgi:hypothetical protein
MLISPKVNLTDEVRRFLFQAKPFDNSTLALRQMVERSLHAKHFFTYKKYSVPHQIRRSSDEVRSLFSFQLIFGLDCDFSHVLASPEDERYSDIRSITC